MNGSDSSRLTSVYLTLTSLTLLILIIAIGWPSTASAQTTEGRIVGAVVDQTGGRLPGVTVTATHLATNVKRAQVITNDAGTFTLAALPPGTYDVDAELPGFKRSVTTGLVLQVNQEVRLSIVLEVGELTEQVTVESGVPLVNTERGSLGEVIEEKSIVDLPLNGRDFTQLALLTPGTVASPQLGREAASSVYIGGNRNTKTEFLIDGMAATGLTNGGSALRPSIDAIQEFKVQSNSFSAEFGRAPGLINIALKSGTNNFHGTLFEFLRNDVVNARDFFQPDVAPFKRNQFGGTIGGPIQKNSAFFFFSWQSQRERRGQTFNSLVPTPSQRRGDFSKDAAIFDPDTTRTLPEGGVARDPFPNNIIPAQRISPQAAFFLPFFPQPNSADGKRFVYAPSATRDFDQFDARVDVDLTENDKIFTRWSFIDRSETLNLAFPTIGKRDIDPNFANAVVNWTHTFSPTLILEARGGYHRNDAGEQTSSPGNLTVQSGITGFTRTSAEFPGFPTLGVSGFQSLAFCPTIEITDNIFQAISTLTWMKGNHALKAGFDLRFHEDASFNAANSRGNFAFSGTFTSNPARPQGTGNGFADYLLGLPFSARRSFPRNLFGNYFSNWHLFVQDDWDVAPNFTLNLGLRYEYNPWPNGLRDQLAIFDEATGKIILSTFAEHALTGQEIAPAAFQVFRPFFVEASALGLGRQILRNDRNNLAPRLGLAWRPFGGGNKFVLRAGYGVFYLLVNVNGRTSGIINPPFLVDEFATNTVPTPTRTLQSFFFAEPPSAALPPSISSFPIDSRSGYVQQWNLAVQSQIGDIALEAAYAANKGTKLDRERRFNDPRPGPGNVQNRRPFPAFGFGASEENAASSIYHSAQFKVEKRTGDLNFLLAYTISKSIDDASTDFNDVVQDPLNFRAQRGISDFDIPQVFVFSNTYQLPFGRGKAFGSAAGPAMAGLISGWSITGITTLHSGSPFTPRVAGDIANTGSATQRPNRVGSGKLDNPTPEKWFDKTAFEVANNFTFGNSGRNILRGDGYVNFDFSVIKRTQIRETVNVEFRTEFFNVFNLTNFSTPDPLVNRASGGQVFVAREPRVLQFGLKVNF